MGDWDYWRENAIIIAVIGAVALTFVFFGLPPLFAFCGFVLAVGAFFAYFG